MAWVSLDNLTRFYTKLKEKIYSKTEVDTKIDVLNTAIANISPLNAYPVGSIYMSINSTNPSTLFGGTLEQLKDRFLIGAGNSYAINATGGSTTNSHTHSVTTNGTVQSHTLTINEMPSHSHVTGSWLYGAGDVGGGYYHTARSWGDTTRNINTNSVGGGKGHSHGFSGATVTSGGASDTNNMPPYLVVYMWKRTA